MIRYAKLATASDKSFSQNFIIFEKYFFFFFKCEDFLKNPRNIL